MIVLAIDPGSTQSGYVIYDAAEKRVLDKGKLDNEQLAGELYKISRVVLVDVLAVEMAESFGAKVWDQVFKAVLWAGRFIEAWSTTTKRPYALMYRRDVKTHITGSGRAKDGQVRQCLLDRWGGVDVAVGSKAAPGPLYGIKADIWAALAIAVTFADIGSRNGAKAA